MKPQNWVKRVSSDGIYSLREAQNSLLQVLLPKFELSRAGYGRQLDIAFDETSDAIRHREAKTVIRERMPDFPSKIEEIQSRVDGVMFGADREYWHSNPSFAFRYASGGTLPIIERDGQDYYCLFYRDVHPVGWNIANGATDSLAELLNPKLAIERELREELIILDRRNQPHRDYQFSWEGDHGVSLPEFAEARSLWSLLIGGTPISAFERIELPVRWTMGPDTLRIRFNRGGDIPREGFFLNINAADFGIELDRIGRIETNRNTVLLDGEINDNRLLNRPVGLFEVEKTQEGLLGGVQQFLPDRLFLSAGREPQRYYSTFDTLTERIIKERFFSYLLERGIRNQEQIKKWWRAPEEKRFALCPVTRQIIRRHIQTQGIQVFLSYDHRDERCAEKLQKDLRAKGIEVWRDRDKIRAGDRPHRAIEAAIKACSHFVLLATDASVESRYVDNEIDVAWSSGKPAITLRRGACSVPMQARGWPELPLEEPCLASEQLTAALRRYRRRARRDP